MRMATAAWWREPQPGPTQVPNAVRGCHTEQPTPALIGRQKLLRRVLEDLARDPKVRRIKNPRSKLRGIGGRKEADQKNAASCGEYVPKEIQILP